MSDVMLHGVLNMPPELWSGSHLDVYQRHHRYIQASRRIANDEEAITGLVAALVAIVTAWEAGSEFSQNEIGVARALIAKYGA